MDAASRPPPARPSPPTLRSRRDRLRPATRRCPAPQQQQQQHPLPAPGRRASSVACRAQKEQQISGYTPAQYIEYSKHYASHEASVEVDASPSVCFAIWDDWRRLVDFLDLIAQVRAGGPAAALGGGSDSATRSRCGS